MNSWLTRRAFIVLSGFEVKPAISFWDAIPSFEEASRATLQPGPSAPLG